MSSRQRPSIPDLRDNYEITLEHCSVLIERVKRALDEMDGSSDFGFADEIDPSLLLYQFEEHLKPKVFTHLFSTDFGKNILVGMFIQNLLDRISEQEIE